MRGFVVGMAASVLAACVGGGEPAVRSPSNAPGPAAVPSANLSPSGAASPSAVASTSPSAVASPSPVDRVAEWRDDFERLVPGMEALHPDLYHGVRRSALHDAVAALEREIPDLNDDQVMVRLLEIVAMVSDQGREGHTGAFVWGTGTYPVHSLPLRVWPFPDGVFVVDALPPYEDLVGQRVVSVAGRPVESVFRTIAPLVPHDNRMTITLVTPRFLLIPEVLHGLGLIDEVGPVELGLEGSAAPLAIEPVEMTEYNAWAGEYGLFLPPKAGVRWLSRSEEPIWFERIPGTGALYVQYNRVEFFFDADLSALRRAVAAPGVERIVVDIRNNFGGQTHAFPDVVRVLTRATGRGTPIVVITGRNTFSAASLFAARLERTADPLFVGEAMGGSPNLYGNPRDVLLSNSGIDVSVATGSFVGNTRDDPRLTIAPDVPAPMTSADYFAGRDPAVRAALTAPR